MLYPLKFKPVYKDYIWGGRELENFGKNLPNGIVAESWEISNHPDGESIVSNGEYKGFTLTTLIKTLGLKLIGTSLSEECLVKFPLLIKLIDANDKLSVQVHPEDNYAKLNENGEYGKNEMWYILSAKKSSKIVYGVKPGITKEIFAAAIENDTIEECLNYLEVSTGDSVNIPAGLIHAIGDGIVIAEIQQNSNTTYRVFDYNRADKEGNKRPLHIKKSLEVIDFNNCSSNGKLKGILNKIDENSTKTYLVANKYFSVEKYNLFGNVDENAHGDKFIIYTVIAGQGELIYDGGVETLSKGESVLIPAALGKYSIKGNLELIKSYVPDLEKDIINPLVQNGFLREDILKTVIS